MSRINFNFALQRGDFQLAVDVAIPDSGVTGIFGPSGSGKTTLLRCIAGLEPTTDTTPVHKREIGFVFQQPQLFPHMSVEANIHYGLRRTSRRSIRFDEVVSLLDVEHLLPRRTTTLSGGESQRVAIARALCQSPRMVLMDEPLSAVDESRKDRLLPYLDRLKSDLDIPVVYVSHDIDEICRLCDHLLVFDDGRIVADGDLHTVLCRTDLPQLGGANTGVVLEARVDGYDAGFDLSTLGFDGGSLSVPGKVTGENVRVRVAANDVSLALEKATASSVLNILPARVTDVTAEDSSTALVSLAVGEATLIARLTNKSVHHLGLRPGDQLFAQVKSVTIRH